MITTSLTDGVTLTICLLLSRNLYQNPGRPPPTTPIDHLLYSSLLCKNPIMSEPTTPKNESSGASLPQTPSLSTFALTEYTANPSPGFEEKLNGLNFSSVNATTTTDSTTAPSSSSISSQIPQAFLLPNGYPDVLSEPQSLSLSG